MKSQVLPIESAYTLRELYDGARTGDIPDLAGRWGKEIDVAMVYFEGGADQSTIILELLELIGDERLQEAARKVGLFE